MWQWVTSAVDWMGKVFGYVRESKADRHTELVKDGILKVRRYSERARSHNARHRYYTREMLTMQMQHGQADLIDEILLSMEKDGLARQLPTPGLWEIAPFV